MLHDLMPGEPEVRGLLALLLATDAGRLAGYHYLPAIKAELLHQVGRTAEARLALRRALELTRNETEREFLTARLATLSTTTPR